MFQHAEQDANFYVNIDKIYASTPDELKAMVNAKYKNRLLLQIDENEIKRSVFITFKIDQVELDNTEIIRDIKIHVCSVSCHEMLKAFTFEPCKIAYCYKS